MRMRRDRRPILLDLLPPQVKTGAGRDLGLSPPRALAGIIAHMGLAPPDVLAEAAALHAAVEATVPAKADENLLVATWNLRAFGGLTKKWAAADADKPK